MAFDPIRPDNQPNLPTPPGVGTPPPPQPAPSLEQEVRTMRADLSAAGGSPAPSALPTFDAEEPAFTPETTNATAPQSVDQLISEGGQGHKLWLAGGIGGFIVLALVGYFVVYPLLNKTDVAPTEPPAVTPPAEPPATGQPAAPAHKSLFINTPAGTVTKSISVLANGALNRAEIKGTLVSAAATAKDGATEIIFTGTNGEKVALGDILLALAPELSTSNVNTLLEADGTIFIYKDSSGAWPGYAGEFKAGASPAAIAAFSQQLEKINANNFFVVDPGTLAPFKSGTVNGVPDRYAPGSTPSASFGYLTTKNRLLISTSFNGMKEALRLMGL